MELILGLFALALFVSGRYCMARHERTQVEPVPTEPDRMATIKVTMSMDTYRQFVDHAYAKRKT